uniref:Pentacotripeptide-repeat region of PRORP domain-containing protein n=1 Tax=Peronospora matthiolae TaxID=2874970 RepID=A0AAV1V8B3_9STRA
MASKAVRRFATAAVRAAPAPKVAAAAKQQQQQHHLELLLEQSIVRCDASRALATFDKLQTTDHAHGYSLAGRVPLLQRLALLLSKHGRPHEALRAAPILSSILRQAPPRGQADDRLQVAVLYTLDACLEQQRQTRRGLDEALVLYAAATEQQVLLDLPALEALLQALVDARRVDEAVVLLHNVVAQHDSVRPTERTCEAVLVAMMQQKRYEEVVDVIEHGRAHAVAFSPETYDVLVDLSQEQYTAANVERLGKFMEYVNDALRADGYWEEDDEDDDSDDEVGGDDDDDDDDDGVVFDDDEFDDDEFD